MPLGIIGAITAFFQLFPTILEMIKMFAATPEEKRAAKLKQIHDAFKDAKEHRGDTSSIEDLLK
jgi:hypothetical protein